MLNCSTTIELGASHLPELKNMEAFVDLATLCNFGILSNLIDPRTYNFEGLVYGHKATATHLAQREEHDYNALSPSDRLQFSYCRGLAINLIHWVHCHYTFKDEDGNLHDFVTLSREYLHQQIRAIVKYKLNAEKENIGGIPNCTSSDLRRQIKLLFQEGMGEFKGVSLGELRDATSLAWTPELTPEKRINPLEFKGMRYS